MGWLSDICLRRSDIGDQEASLRSRAIRDGACVEVLHPLTARVQDDKRLYMEVEGSDLGESGEARGRKKLTQRSQRAQSSQRREKQELGRRESVTFERKSPPLHTKGGAPSSSIERWRD